MTEGHHGAGARGSAARGEAGWVTRHALSVAFVCLALCAGGIYSAYQLPSSVFPRTDFPRVVILVDSGVMPADEMMATITRPIEESMKDIPGALSVKSATGRGSAEINVFFNWSVDMVQSELYVVGRLSQIRATLPAEASTSVFRLTFSAFPIVGVSLTSSSRELTSLWETARYTLKPRFLQIPGVARVDLVGGRAPEFHVVVDPTRLQAAGLGLTQVTEALTRNNLVAPTGMHEENHTLYLSVVDSRARSADDIRNMVIEQGPGGPVRVRDVARVERGEEPVFNVVTADGVNAVLLNVRSQPDGSTLDIARQLHEQIRELGRELPPDMKLAFFYDQSLIVSDSVRSVWEAIGFGLVLSVAIIFLFLRTWGTTLVATLVIPVTILLTLVAMRIAGLTFNLMTLGGIAAAVGLVIDDAIVVVEAIHSKMASGLGRLEAVQTGVSEIFRPLVGSTLTPVVVFIPLAFLDGITGVFFRALALTMVTSLLTSLVLAVSLTPALALWFTPASAAGRAPHRGPALGTLGDIYEWALRRALGHRWITLVLAAAVLAGAAGVYLRLDSEFLPPMDEGGFVIDYRTPPGTSLSETSRQLLQAEDILRATPEVESYSRRTGARLALAIAEPNTGDFLVKLRASRQRSTEDVIAYLRERFAVALPGVQFEFPGILGDLIGDLMWAPQPIEIKLYSTDTAFLKAQGPRIEQKLRAIPGVVDTFDGLTYAGTTLRMSVRTVDAARLGFTAGDIAAAVSTAMLGDPATTMLEGDRVVTIRVKVDPARIGRIASLRDLPLRSPAGAMVHLADLVDITEEAGQLELRREDLRQDIAITARLEGRDLGGAMADIQRALAGDPEIPPGAIEYGGLFEQQQASFRNLAAVLAMAIVLVFTVLLVEFRSFAEPVAIVTGAVLSLFGTTLALWLTGTSLNVVSFLGAIIGIGIVAKNGILMLDFVDHFLEQGDDIDEALVKSGRRRLRPVLMTSLAAALGMLPLAWGIGSGADMLKPLAIAVMGALAISVLLSLVATPTVMRVLRGRAA
ncbi:MAG: efflux RND transporter permease subunit [Vicinamibacterales bacterium]